MEIKENEFIRTKTGKIDKVINNNYYMSQYIECEKRIVEKEYIVKHSFNIIDWIEVGDFVNENEVIDKYLFNGEMPVLETTGDETNAKCMCEGDIKTILTHEQYERNCYRLEDN